ncbi:nitrite reductase (NAD(P)H) small subunit [Prauserella sp. PE36]|uniref:Nitrite reductase small subunit NirD n=1 Tax=Prauserella endophytica TaxID=1592324 RepID=A0ABY2RXR3_9PSEU|nr:MULTISPECIES: nitrite reductase small subunit NirD [Prauserella]RBM11204.1 nitrite reductase (NAD(P)H) small subunit [Prauserella sp. PE36]TKG64483.1 nitrite reductase small subunit NirD [Prauserella endophytica]
MTATAERTWVAVCRADAVLRAYGVAALLENGEQVAIFRTWDDEFYGLSNLDPFSGAAVLSRGIVGDAGGLPVVASPIYKQQFELRTGRCLDDETVRVATYPVRVVDGVVHVGSP